MPTRAQRRAGRLDEAKTALSRASNGGFSDFVVEIVLVLRRQDQFIHSAYLENIMEATPLASLSFREFREAFVQAGLRYEDNLRAFQKTFGRVRVMVYENLRNDGRLCRNFLREIGFDMDDLAEPGKVRESLTIRQARLKRSILPLVVARGVNRRINSLVRSYPATRLAQYLWPHMEAGFWGSELERRQWQRNYDAQNERIRQRFLPAHPILFPPETTESTE